MFQPETEFVTQKSGPSKFDRHLFVLSIVMTIIIMRTFFKEIEGNAERERG